MRTTPRLVLPPGRIDHSARKGFTTLHSFQHRLVAERLADGETVSASLEHSPFAEDFAVPYAWMTEQVSQRTSQAPNGSVFWGWARARRADLMAQAAAEHDHVLLTLEIETGRLLFSDFERWHFALNHCPMWTMEEEKEAERLYGLDEEYNSPLETRLLALYGTTRYDQLDTLGKALVRDSWSACLLTAPDPTIRTQACFATIAPSDVRTITPIV